MIMNVQTKLYHFPLFFLLIVFSCLPQWVNGQHPLEELVKRSPKNIEEVEKQFFYDFYGLESDHVGEMFYYQTSAEFHNRQDSLKKINQQNNIVALFEKTRWGETLKQLTRWKAFFTPRLYPSGEFRYVADNMWTEIQRLQSLEQNNLRQIEGCEISYSWENVGPFIQKSENPTSYTTDANDSFHNSPTPGIGRTSVLSRHPSTEDLYLGASNGGLWKSTDDGQSWEDLSSSLPVMGVADIAYSPDTTTMYLATGDKTRIGGLDYLGFTQYSVGVLKSTDNGDTWQPLHESVTWSSGTTVTQESLLKINRLVVSESGELFVCTSDNLMTPDNDAGIWRYDETTHNWDLKLISPSFQIAFIDMEVISANVLIAGTTSGKIARSLDGGGTFTFLGTSEGLPTGGLGYKRVAIESVDTTIYIVYAIAGSTNTFAGLFKSTDNGSSFIQIIFPLDFQMNGLGQAEQRLGFTINPLDVNELWIAAAREIWKITVDTATNTATPVATTDRDNIAPVLSYVHPDVHDFEWAGTSLCAAHDGGVSRTDDSGTTWTKWYELTTDLCITECLRMGTAFDDNTVISTGTYDNGLFRYYSAQTPHWVNYQEADYISTLAESSGIIYGCNFTGTIRKFIQNVDLPASWSSSAIFTEESSGLLSRIYNPLVMHSTNSDILYTGRTNLWKTVDAGENWINMTLIPGSVPPMSIFISGEGLNIVAISASDPDVLYVAKASTNEFIIYKTTDGGTTWTDVYVLPTDLEEDEKIPSLYMNRLAIHPLNPDYVVAVFSGYSMGKKVYRSLDGGETWENISGDMPNLPVNSIALYLEDPTVATSTLNIVVGNDVGVYYTNEKLFKCGKWYPLSTGFPKVIVQDLAVFTQSESQILRAATFGRGIWETTLDNANCTCCVDDIEYDIVENCDLSTGELSLTVDITEGTPPFTYAIMGGTSETLGDDVWSFTTVQ